MPTQCMDVYTEPDYRYEPVTIPIEGRSKPPYVWWFRMSGIIETIPVDPELEMGRYDTDGQWIPDVRSRGVDCWNLGGNVDIQIHPENINAVPHMEANMALRQIWPMGPVVYGDVIFTMWGCDEGELQHYAGHWDWRALRELRVPPRGNWNTIAMHLPATIGDHPADKCMLLPVTPWMSQWMVDADWNSYDDVTHTLYRKGMNPRPRYRAGDAEGQVSRLPPRDWDITYASQHSLKGAYGSGERRLDRVDTVDDETLRGILESLGIVRTPSKQPNNILEPEEYEELTAPVRMVEAWTALPEPTSVPSPPSGECRYPLPMGAFCELYMKRSAAMLVPTSSMLIEHWSASRTHIRLEVDLGMHYLHCTARILAMEAVADASQIEPMSPIRESPGLIPQECVVVRLQLSERLGISEEPVRGMAASA